MTSLYSVEGAPTGPPSESDMQLMETDSDMQLMDTDSDMQLMGTDSDMQLIETELSQRTLPLIKIILKWLPTMLD